MKRHAYSPERVELMIRMTAKRKKQFETPVGRFSYLYCPKAAFSIGVKLEDAGDQKAFLFASPENGWPEGKFGLPIAFKGLAGLAPFALVTHGNVLFGIPLVAGTDNVGVGVV